MYKKLTRLCRQEYHWCFFNYHVQWSPVYQSANQLLLRNWGNENHLQRRLFKKRRRDRVFYSAAYKWFTAWKLVSKNICQIDKVRPVEFDFWWQIFFSTSAKQICNWCLFSLGFSKNSFYYLTSPLIPLPRKIRGLRQKRGKGKFLEMPFIQTK